MESLLHFIQQNFPILFPLSFVALWFGGATLMGALSGWYQLAARFPDLPDRGELLGLHTGQRGALGGISIKGILTLETYTQGLRLRITRIFGPMNRPIFIPWTDIGVERTQGSRGPAAVLSFGQGRTFAPLEIDAALADSLRRDAKGFWPEAG